MPKGTDSHAKKKAIDDAMNWLRNNDPTRRRGRSDSPGAGEPYPCPAGVCLRRRRPVVEDSPKQRNNELKPEDVNEPLLRL
jgi:hypothetical protein